MPTGTGSVPGRIVIRITADAPGNATELQGRPGDVDLGDGEVSSARLFFM
jgi:hypothetical protein